MLDYLFISLASNSVGGFFIAIAEVKDIVFDFLPLSPTTGGEYGSEGGDSLVGVGFKINTLDALIDLDGIFNNNVAAVEHNCKVTTISPLTLQYLIGNVVSPGV